MIVTTINGIDIELISSENPGVDGYYMVKSGDYDLFFTQKEAEDHIRINY
jgi:hypothetical protein